MTKFKVGDRVEWAYRLDWHNDGGRIKPHTPYLIDRIHPTGFLDLVGSYTNPWSPERFKKIGGTMSKYQDLKERIGRVEGWTKEADDILQEIYQNSSISHELQVHKEKVWVWEGNNWISLNFVDKSQCERNNLFKEGLMILLDHSDIKKDIVGTDQKIEIEGKTYKARIVEEY